MSRKYKLCRHGNIRDFPDFSFDNNKDGNDYFHHDFMKMLKHFGQKKFLRIKNYKLKLTLKYFKGYKRTYFHVSLWNWDI